MGCMNIRFVRVHDSPTLLSVFLHSPKILNPVCYNVSSFHQKFSVGLRFPHLNPSYFKSYEDAQGHIDILSFAVEQSTMRKITNLRYGKKQKIHDYHCFFLRNILKC